MDTKRTDDQPRAEENLNDRRPSAAVRREPIRRPDDPEMVFQFVVVEQDYEQELRNRVAASEGGYQNLLTGGLTKSVIPVLPEFSSVSANPVHPPQSSVRRASQAELEEMKASIHRIEAAVTALRKQQAEQSIAATNEEDKETQEVWAYLNGPIALSKTAEAQEATERLRTLLQELHDEGVTDEDFDYLFGESDAPTPAHR